MDKLKNILQRDKEGSQDPQDSSSTGRVAGQGSHLSKATSSAEGNTGSLVEQPTTELSPGTNTTGISSTSRETGDNTGSAAIGQTSTYSSHTLRHGDPIGSVLDHSSQDPTTYKMPEHTFGQGTSASGEKSSSGVPAGAAGTAASLAFSKHNESSTPNIPGAFPRETAHDSATLPPVNRPIDYEAGRAAPESTQPSSAALPTGTSGVSGEGPARTEAQKSGTLGKILGAVGLGGAATGAGAAASKAGDDRSQAVVDTPDQPTTTTGVSSYTAPTQSGPPPSHHRKESIPTTAYPAGPSSPSPIQAPVGGTRGAPDEIQGRTSSITPSGPGATSYTIGGPVESEDRSHTDRSAGLAAGGVGAGVGAAALGAHEYGKSRADAPSGTTSSALPGTAQTTSGSTVPSAGQGLTSSSIPSTTQGTSGYGRDQPTGITGQSVGPTSQISSTEPENQSSGYGKTAAAAGLGAGAGALGAHEYEKHRGDATGTTASSALPGTQSTTGSTLPSSSQAASSSTVPAATQSTTSSGLPSATGTGLQHGTTRDQPITSSGPTSQVSTTEPDKHSSGYGKTAAATGLGAGGAAGATALQHDRQPESTQQFADKPWQADQTTGKSSTAAETSLPVREKATSQTPVTSTRDNIATHPATDDSHTGRDATLAGAAGAGAGAYGAHEYSKHQAEQDAARRQKDLAEQEAARQKQFEKDQKAAEKLARKEEKQHEKDLKKLEKAEEKSHEKELKKEEKAHHKAVAKEEKEHQKELDKEEKERSKQDEEERKRREKEAAAVAGTAGAGGAAYAAHRHDADVDDKTKLSSEHDHERNRLHKEPREEKKPGFFKRIFKRRKNKDTGDSEEYSTDEEDHTAAGTHLGGAGAGAGAAGAGLTGTAGDKSYEAASGGQQKPSYNPLSKDDPTSGTAHGIHDPATSSSITHGTSSSTTAPEKTKDGLPIDDVTGLPYDPAKDPEAAKRLAAHDTLGHRILEKAEAKAEQKDEQGEAPLS